MNDELKQNLNETQAKNQSRRAAIGVGAMGVAAMALGGKAASAQTNSPVAAAGTQRLLTEREITYRSGGAEIKAFYAEPIPRPRAAIIIIHEIWGLNAHIRDVARRFARQGYVTLAPDLYTREGAPKFDVNDRGALMKFLASISDTRMIADLQVAIEYLNGQGISRVGSLGFCMGGLYSYLLATKSDNLQAAVDFYGRIVYAETTANKPESPLALASQLKCPLLGIFGEQDASIPVGDVEQLRQALAGSTQSWKINVYPGAGHAFFNDTRPAYHAPSAADVGTEVLRFLGKHLREDQGY